MVEFDDGAAQQIFNPDVPQLARTELALNPPLCRWHIHDLESGIERGIDDFGFSGRGELLNGNDEALGTVILENPRGI